MWQLYLSREILRDVDVRSPEPCRGLPGHVLAVLVQPEGDEHWSDAAEGGAVAEAGGAGEGNVPGELQVGRQERLEKK